MWFGPVGFEKQLHKPLINSRCNSNRQTQFINMLNNPQLSSLMNKDSLDDYESIKQTITIWAICSNAEGIFQAVR